MASKQQKKPNKKPFFTQARAAAAATANIKRAEEEETPVLKLRSQNWILGENWKEKKIPGEFVKKSDQDQFGKLKIYDQEVH